MRVTIGQLRRVIREEIVKSRGNHNLDEGFFDKIKSMFGGGDSEKWAKDHLKKFHERIEKLRSTYKILVGNPSIEAFTKSPRGKEVVSYFSNSMAKMEEEVRKYEDFTTKLPKDRKSREIAVTDRGGTYGPRIARAEQNAKEALADLEKEGRKFQL